MAQKEASIWYFGNGNGLDFRRDLPAVINDAPVNFHNMYMGTISDRDGNLLFYTDNVTVWNADGEVMEGGDSLGSEQFSFSYVVPLPGNKNQYYIFYTGFQLVVNPWGSCSSDHVVMYAIVDISANNGKGRVISKDNIIHKYLNHDIAVAVSCTGNKFWVIGPSETNCIEDTDKFYAFRVTTEGVDTMPVISTPASMGHSLGIRISPQGNRLVYNYGGNSPFDEGTAVSDFDPETGMITNRRNLGPEPSEAEFSPDGNFLYVNYHIYLEGGKTRIIQYDLLNNYKETLLAEDSINYGPLRLAPDGKIYMVVDAGRMAVIENPNLAGLSCNYHSGKLFDFDEPLSIYSLPSMPAYLLYDDPLDAHAGEDREICASESVQLGQAPAAGQLYAWEPETFLNDPHISNPEFKYSGHLEISDSLTYTLTVLNGTCRNEDKVNIVIRPEPEAGISGSRSVCPGVKQVDYFTVPHDGYAYEWSVEGGELSNGQGTEAIRINWGALDQTAKVMLRTTNEFQCRSPVSEFSVRINVELDTEIPWGPEDVCRNLLEDNIYLVTHTTGSEYSWGAIGGAIINGQGTNTVHIDWDEADDHGVWVLETSATADTVCHGSSDTLTVDLYNDSLELIIDFASINPLNETEGKVKARLINNSSVAQRQVNLYRSNNDYVDWELISGQTMPEGEMEYYDSGLDADNRIYHYYLQSVNNCLETVTSALHNTILLTGEKDESANSINLSWNPYRGWADDAEWYEIYRKLDEDTNYVYLDRVGGNLTNCILHNGPDGFSHSFLVRAVSHDPRLTSWSNNITLEFEHPIFIPNIITPNGDGYNDTFEITSLESYPDNLLVICNRWGREIFRMSGYKGGWKAGGVTQGVYFYELFIGRDRKTYKGWLEVLK